jgi:hypothetical protein
MAHGAYRWSASFNNKGIIYQVFVKYYPLTEGYLDYDFIIHLFKGFNRLSKKVQFSVDKKAPVREPRSDTKVIKEIRAIVQSQFYKTKQLQEPHIVVAGIDEDGMGYEHRLNQLLQKLHGIPSYYYLLFVSVRVIEAWALYLITPELENNTLESKSKQVLSQMLGINGSAKERGEKIIEMLKSKDCFNEQSLGLLTEKSASFRHFKNKVEELVQYHSTFPANQ